MPANDKPHAAREETYADCLNFLSADAEKKGFRRVASTLKEARRQISALAKESVANDNVQSPPL
jgi:hypothetical protein